MTTTVIARGSDWGIFANHGVYANWGDIEPENGKIPDYNATYNMLGDMVVSKFHEVARENGSTAHWIPQTSEVIADIADDKYPIGEWMETARQSIFNQWVDGEIEPIWLENDDDEFNNLYQQTINKLMSKLESI